jgi:feruloyl esterase
MNEPNILSRLFMMRWGMGATFPVMTFDFDHDVDRLDARLSSTLNANDSDLNEFARHGGKLILYNGLADPAVPYPDTVGYYERVLATVGEAQGFAFARLFLVPGMGHCMGGPGPSEFGQPSSPTVPTEREADALMTLVAWTEGAAPPDHLLARSPGGPGVPPQERPVCAYPAFPEFLGGDPAKRSSFACRAHPRSADQFPSPRYTN